VTCVAVDFFKGELASFADIGGYARSSVPCYEVFEIVALCILDVKLALDTGLNKPIEVWGAFPYAAAVNESGGSVAAVGIEIDLSTHIVHHIPFTCRYGKA
jgi:hypothetical protein